MESTLQRVLEPEYMDTVEEAVEYDAMDHGSANEDVVAAFLEHGGSGLVLDIGTGPAHIPLLLAQRAPQTTVVAMDAARHMLRVARAHVATRQLASRVHLQQADAKLLPYASAAFDGVLSNTILHHIPEPVVFLREAYRVLRPGGLMLVRDLFRPYDHQAARALVELHAGDATQAQRKLLFDSLCAALTLGEARAAAAEAGLQNARVEPSSDRHYTILCSKPRS